MLISLRKQGMLISSEFVTAEMLISHKGSKMLKALVVRVHYKLGSETSLMLFSRVRASAVVCLGN